jgi:atlastin
MSKEPVSTISPSLSTDEPVLVEHDDVDDDEASPAGGGSALQIVSIGTEENQYAFSFQEDNLNEILSKVPPGWKVAVVSVVGAFRTGKSFLLSWFLRYLHTQSSASKQEEADSMSTKWYETFQSLGNDGFDWRGGAERNTTGIWMWSEPHFIGDDDKIAVLLVDTQGMFDHETTMALTASIFGLSTLLSSYQIYNVDKRIQEDNLQQLALFSEYARMAMATEHHDKNKADDEKEEDEDKPFQTMEFLVRDWQHFEEEEDYAAMEKEMEEYLEGVIAERDAKDLQDTREQILSCFETLSCFAMTHPGFAVTKKKYTGDVNAMEKTFLHLLDRYCHRVFKGVEPKKIHGRELTAVELGSYIKAYAELFASGAHFPEAATLLEATAAANNTNAVHLAMSEYKHRMDRIAGPHCTNYVKPEELEEMHKEVSMSAKEVFDDIATFGNARDIEEARGKLADQVEESFVMYKSLNDGRNPLAGLET